MKISDLTKSSQLLRGMQIPVAIEGENRVVELGQLLDAMAAAVVPFSDYNVDRGPFGAINEGKTEEDLPIAYVASDKRFYAVKTVIMGMDGVFRKIVHFYTEFVGAEKYMGTDGSVRRDCLFIDAEGKLYQYDGEKLLSVGMTEEQAAQLSLLVPEKVESEATMEAMEKAGLIVPGQIYYIPEND